jgi:hypothetical protein
MGKADKKRATQRKIMERRRAKAKHPLPENEIPYKCDYPYPHYLYKRRPDENGNMVWVKINMGTT